METAMNVGDWRIFVYAPDNQLQSDTTLLPDQVHGATIVRAEQLIEKDVQADGVLLSYDSPKAGIQTADCMPLICITPKNALALHISRKTLIAGLLDTVPQHISPSDITHIWIGPHICESHFTFAWEGDEIMQFRKRFPLAVRDNPTALSLRRAVQTYFDDWNIESSCITEDGRCTYEEKSLPSYKRWLEQEKQGPLGRITTALQQ